MDKFQGQTELCRSSKIQNEEKKVCNETREANTSFEYRLAQNIKENPKTFSAYVRSRSEYRSEIGSLRWQDKIVEDDENKAGLLNEFFALVFTKEDVSTQWRIQGWRPPRPRPPPPHRP